MLLPKVSFWPKVVKYLFPKMAVEADSLCPPLAVRGMTVLDREAFTKSVNVVGAIVPLSSLQPFLKHFKKKQVHKIGLKPTKEVPQGKINPNWKERHKLVLLQAGTVIGDDEKIKYKISEDVFEHKVTLQYKNFLPSEVFEAVMPQDMTSLSAFTEVGHIVHVNLRDHQMPYKTLIAQVLLDKVSQATTVLHKCNKIENKFRTFEFELLGGEPEYVTRVVEHHRTYEFDFTKVFWNTRLSTEHQRLAELIGYDCTVFDVFAGVGPFAVPLAKKGCTVYANDLNPESFKWLQHNAKLNKVELKCFNMDGRDFLRQELCKFLLEGSDTHREVHVVMNLPEIAIEFLDVFQNLGSMCKSPSENELETENGIGWIENCEVHVHCYTFSPPDDAKEIIGQRFKKHFGHPMPEDCKVHHVRNVSPSKRMYCISFDLKKDIFLSGEEKLLEPEKKRIKL